MQVEGISGKDELSENFSNRVGHQEEELLR